MPHHHTGPPHFELAMASSNIRRSAVCYLAGPLFLALTIVCLGPFRPGSLDAPGLVAAESGPVRETGGTERPRVAAPAGEDLGQTGESEDLWERIRQSMRSVERRIREKKTASETQRLQQQIVDDLTRLIEDGERQGGSASAPGTQKPSADSASAEPGDRPGSGAATASSGAPGQPQDTRGELFLRVWGRLPAQLQQQIQSPIQEEFLPEYESLITEYYRRLAEGDRK